MQKSFVKLIALTAVAIGLISSPSVFAQGSVSSGLRGTVVSASGLPAANATVTVKHNPTGQVVETTTNASGRFLVTGLPVGGPFTVTAKGADWPQESIVSDIYTQLGETSDITVRAAGSEVTQLEAFVVTADRNALDAATSGAGSVVDSRRISNQPNINRSFADMIRTNNFVSTRGTQNLVALGQNNRFNSITVDGARINDQFGLAGSGLQSFNNPFSLDALEQFTISLSPYDVRQSGFTGAAVNAVTKSGTNEFRGSAYYIYTDAGLQQKNISGTTVGQRAALDEETWGFTLGGPILKDRLFFFVNYEKFERTTAPITATFRPSDDFISQVRGRIQTLASGVDIGQVSGSAASFEDDEKKLIKFDWNVNRDHRVTARWSETIGNRPNSGVVNSGTSFSQPAQIPGQPSFPNGSTGLSSGFYNIASTEEVWAGQVFSNWSPSLKTEVKYAKTSYSSVSTTPIAFPEIRIFNFPTATDPNATGNAFRFGSEISRHGNILKVDTESFSANGDYLWGDWTFSAGADREESSYYNLFRQGSYGVFNFNNLADFLADRPSGFLRNMVQQGFEIADISQFAQTGVFAQAKWDFSRKLNFTGGVRVDFTESPIVPPLNSTFNTAFASFFPGINNAATIDGTTTVSPRLSFNYAVDEQRNTQVRGGVGVFLGRTPWVWISNSYGNAGVGRYLDVRGATTAPTLASYLATQFDRANPIGQSAAIPPASTAVVNLIDNNLRLPTVLRGNLALDHKLPTLGATATVEFIYTQNQEAFFVENLNLRTSGAAAADGRVRFAGSTTTAPLVAGFGNVIRIRNIAEGETAYVSVGINRPVQKGWGYSASYTRGRARDAQVQGSSTANSNWQFNPVFNQGQVTVTRSDFEVRDRLQASITKEFKWWRNLVTSATIYYEGRSGSPYSWVYSGDLNGDGLNGNDLIAVPANSADPRFDFSGMTSAQQAAYFAFLDRNGISQFAGSYAPRNSFLQPWTNRLDLHLSQEIPTYGRVKVELFMDMINFGSWLAKDIFTWQETLNQNATNTGLTRTLGNASYTTTGLIRPTATFNADNTISLPNASRIDFDNGASRWRVQLGARLKF